MTTCIWVGNAEFYFRDLLRWVSGPSNTHSNFAYDCLFKKTIFVFETFVSMYAKVNHI